MAPSSITIKIDFGSENAADTSTGASLNGGIPIPCSSVGFSSSASRRPPEALPTPFSNAAQGPGQVDSAAPPTPTSCLMPAGSMGSANNASLQGNVPTPFSLGLFSSALTGGTAHAVPTPLDNLAHSMGSTATNNVQSCV